MTGSSELGTKVRDLRSHEAELEEIASGQHVPEVTDEMILEVADRLEAAELLPSRRPCSGRSSMRSKRTESGHGRNTVFRCTGFVMWETLVVQNVTWMCSVGWAQQVSQPYARLDRKTRLRVLCGATVNGRFICVGELARVGILDPQQYGRPERSEEIRVLCMLDGWRHRAPGHWTLNNHSARRLAGAQRAVTRGLLAPKQYAARSRPRFRRPKETSRRTSLPDVNMVAYPALGPTDNYVVQPWPAGILADCPRCGRTNVLDADMLNVEPA